MSPPSSACASLRFTKRAATFRGCSRKKFGCWRRSVMPPTCPPDELLARFLSEQPSTINVDELEAHLSACDHCRNRMEQLAARAEATPQIVLHAHPPLAPEFAQRLEESLRDSLNGVGESEWAAPQIPGYDLLELIGRGGSSLVFRAHDQQLHCTVAIKI